MNIGKNRFAPGMRVAIALAGALTLSACGGGGSGSSTPSDPVNKNSAPVSDAGNMKISAVDTPVFISGLSSKDNDGDALTYTWEVVSSPEGSSYSVEATDKPVLQFAASTEGEYVIQLTVSDGQSSSTSTTKVLVDLDGDGVASANDVDLDGDGIANPEDAFPSDPSEFLDSDENGTGNYSQADEDGDGTADTADAYPLDPAVTDAQVYIEQEPNDNPSVTNATGMTVPLRVGGIVQEPGDSDFFRFAGLEGKNITATCQTGNEQFHPSLSVLTVSGGSMQLSEPYTEGSALDEAISFQLPASGEYVLTVGDFNNAGDVDFEYACRVFYDTDFDGIADDVEIAHGLNKESSDTDSDGVNDAAEFYTGLSENPFDVDQDGIPNWLDRDSDGDMIPDAIELFGDSDNDGVANFLDLDSDGNSISDLVEAGLNPTNPADTDIDGTPDFADVDDDNDGILDINDGNRLEQVATSDIASNLNEPANLFYISDASTTLDQDSMVKTGVPGELLVIEGQGFASPASENIVIFESDGKTLNIPATEATSSTLSVPFPEIGDSTVTVVKGSLKTNRIGVESLGANNPMIYDTGLLRLDSGYATIEGRNFKAPLTINIGGQSVDATSVYSDSFSFYMPFNATSGELFVIGPNGTSNKVDYRFVDDVSAYLSIPQNATVSRSDLKLASGNDVPKAFGTYSTSVDVADDSPQILSAMLDSQNGTDSTVYLMGLYVPGDYSVDIDSLGTAVAYTMVATDTLQTVAKESLRDAKNLAEDLPEVEAFGELIANKVTANSAYLDDPDTEFGAAFDSANTALTAAIEEALANGDLVAADPATTSASNLDVKITPEQHGIEIIAEEVQTYLPTETPYTGDVTVLNDTRLFLSPKVIDSASGMVLQDHINSYFDPNIIGSQSSGLYFSSETNLNHPDFKNAQVEIITSGTTAPRTQFRNAHTYLTYRMAIENLIIPTLEVVVGELPDSTAKTLISMTLAYAPSRIDAHVQLIMSGDLAAFVNTYNGFIIKEIQSGGPMRSMLIDLILGKLIEDVGDNRLIATVVKQLSPWGKAYSIGKGATLLVNTGYDLTTTPEQLNFEIEWPLGITDLNPKVVSPSQSSVEVKISGYGFAGLSQGLWSTGLDLPDVRFIDQGNGNSSVSVDTSAVLKDGAEISALIPTGFLDNAVGPLSVEISHGGVTASSDPLTIEVSEELNLSRLSPAKGYPGQEVVISGSGFSAELAGTDVNFRSDTGGSVSATIKKASPSEIVAIIPKGAVSGEVHVSVEGKTSNPANWTLLNSSVTITFGDNGADTDDTFSLFLNGEQKEAMPTPVDTFGPFTYSLPPGRHSATLKGIATSDQNGTYYISFSGVSDISGPPLSGTYLNANESLTWEFTVTEGAQATKAMATQVPKKIWKE
jgi:hypothetical protein